MAVQRIELLGKRFVILPEMEYDRLCRETGEAASPLDEELPPLPKPDENDRIPALEYAPSRWLAI